MSKRNKLSLPTAKKPESDLLPPAAQVLAASAASGETDQRGDGATAPDAPDETVSGFVAVEYASRAEPLGPTPSEAFLTPSRHIKETAAHFGISPAELTARVEAGPVEEVTDDEPSLENVKSDLTLEASGKLDPSALAAAMIRARKARLGPAAMHMQASDFVTDLETAIREVAG